MAKEFVNTQSLGEIRIGIKPHTGSESQTVWFRWEENRLSLPDGEALYGGGKELVLETEKKPDSKYGTPLLFAYFGEKEVFSQGTLSSAIEQDYIIRFYLVRDNASPPLPYRWDTRKDRDTREPDFREFYASYWGIGDAQLTLGRNGNEPVRDTKGEIVSGALSVDFDEWRSQVFKRVLKDVSLAQRADITAPVKGIESLEERSRKALKKAGDSRAFELYFLLEDVLEKFIDFVQTIVQQPHSRLKKTVDRVGLERENIEEYHQRSHAGRPLNVEQGIRVNYQVLPSVFSRSTVRNTYDVAENRYLLHVLGKVRGYVDDVVRLHEKHLEKLKTKELEFAERRGRDPDALERDTHYQNVKKDVRKRREKIARLKQTKQELSIFSGMLQSYGVKAQMPSEISTEVFYYDRRYALVRTLHDKIERSLMGSLLNEDTVELSISPFSNLYAQWCLRKVVEALRSETLGFEMISKAKSSMLDRPDEDERYRRLRSSKDPDLKVDVWYERRYPFANGKEKHGYGIIPSRQISMTEEDEDPSWAHRPDISLEFWHPDFLDRKYPLIVTLDPTISRHERRLRAKGVYADNIVCFDVERYSNRDGEARSLVRAAWALYPGKKEQPLRKWSIDDEYSRGYVTLHPDSEEQFTETLRKIIDRRVIERPD